MVRVQMCMFFWDPKSRFLVQKSNFCHMTPILVNDPFLALGMTVNFPPWERFFDLSFRSYSCFRKKIRLTCQKVFPLPTVEAPSASNSPSALSARAGSYIAFITSGPRCFGTQRNGKTNQRIIVRGLQIPCGELARDLEVNLLSWLSYKHFLLLRNWFRFGL